MTTQAFPQCWHCGGQLVPLSDYGGNPPQCQVYKAWTCTSPSCGFNIKIRNGEIVYNEPVKDLKAGR